MKKMKRGMIILFVGILIILAVALYITFFYAQRCENLKCWNDNLKACDRAQFEKDSEGVIWSYKILGKSDGNCLVNVKVLEIKRGMIKVEVLEGKEMICALPLGQVLVPEVDPNKCHGRLKEEMQTIMITQLYQHIIDSVGEISQGLQGIEGITTSTNSSQNSSG